MKLIKVIGYWVLVLSLLTTNSVVYAVTTTMTPSPTTKNSTPSPTPSSDLIEKLKQIEILKEKIATKVAQLREYEKVALHGTLTSSSSATLNVKTEEGQEHKISYLDDTQFYNIAQSKKTTSTSAKLTLQKTIAVFGYYNEDHSVITAKYVYDISTVPSQMIGKISDVDKEEFTLTVTFGKETQVYDFETSTRAFILNSAKTSWTRAGFSRLAVGDTVRVTGIPDVKEKDRRDAQNIYILFKDATPSAIPTKTS